MINFKIGDKVQVVDNGEGYTYWDDFMLVNGTKSDCIKYNNKAVIKNGFVGEIRTIKPHPDNGSDIAIIADANNSFIINLCGLQKIEPEKSIQEQFNKLEKKIVHMPLVAYNIDCDITLIKMYNKEDFNTVKRYYRSMNKGYGTTYLDEYDEPQFPCVKAIYDCDSFTDFCCDGKGTDQEILIEELSKAIIEINNFNI